MANLKDAHRELVLAALVQYECRLVRYATRLLYGNQDKARDVVQHTFLKLCEQDAGEINDRIGPWLFRVCRNRVFDHYRSDSATESLGESTLAVVDAQQRDPSEIAESSDLMQAVQRLIATLPMAQQEVIELWAQGFKHEEIADVVDKNPGAVRVVLHRAIQTLKAHKQIRSWLREFDSNRTLPNQSISEHPIH